MNSDLIDRWLEPHHEGGMAVRHRFAMLLRHRATLPSFSATSARLFHAARNPHVTLDEIESIVALDPALAMSCVRAATAARLRVSEVNTIKQAVLLAGLGRVLQIAMSAVLIESLRRLNPSVDWRQFWRHSLLVARLAENLGETFGVTPGQGYLAGLFHDVGKTFIQQHYPDEFEEIVAVAQAGNEAVFLAEARVLGLDHAQVGAAIADTLGVPLPVVMAIRYHHDPLAEDCLQHPATGGGLLPACLSVANAAAKRLVVSVETGEPLPPLDALPEFGRLCQFERQGPLDLVVQDELQLVDEELQTFLG